MGAPWLRRAAALRLLVVAMGLSTLRCTLLAPSDADLTGGNGQDAGGGQDGTIPGDASPRDAQADTFQGCNGVVDCSNPKCSTGYSCVADPPSGWTRVGFAPASTSGCPSGFGGPTGVKVAPPDGPDPCGCNCTVQGSSCDQGEFTLLTGTAGACSTTADTFSPQNTCTGVPGNPSIPAGSFVEVEPPASPTGCGASPQPGFSSVSSGRVCAATTGQGCSNGRTCQPTPASPYLGCIESAGQQACPSGYTQTFYVGSNVQDDRKCGACACGVVPCTGSLSLWAHGNCHGTPDLQITTDGTCAAANNGGVLQPNGYTAILTDGGCAVTSASAPVPDAGLVWTGEETVCCP